LQQKAAGTGLTSQSFEVSGALEAIETYFERGWTDGLPIVPPTPEMVASFLEAANRQPGHVLGVETTKGAVITAEKAAINAVMAGCRPEYMPVVAAAVEAIAEDRFNLHGITVSTMGAGILLVVNGPIAERLGMNSAESVFGPGNRANATIGRAIRLIISNVLGTRAGELDKATLGHPGKYTWCIPEKSSRLPWEPLHVTRGLAADDSAVTVFAGLSGLQVGEHEANTPEAVLDAFASRLHAAGAGMQEVLVVICPEHAAHLQRAGWSRQQVCDYLFERTSSPAAGGVAPGGVRGGSEHVPVVSETGALASPEAVVPIVAGGDGGAWSMVIPMWSAGARTRSVTRRINLPG
jgi:hypothetical protein